jgi:hypothetical protein
MPTAREATALILALAADAIQIALLPLFAGGALSPWDDGLDLAMFVILVSLLGWHRLLLPTLAAELIPVLDLCPTWTVAVLIILHRRRSSAALPPLSGGAGRPPSVPRSGPPS